MKRPLYALVASVAALLSAGAMAQTSTAPQPSSGSAAASPPAFDLPEGCRASAGPTPVSADSMRDMQGATGSMDEAHRGLMQAMMRMNPAMMQGMMAKDPDVAFVCGMIAHHLGAVEMAKVEIKYGKDAEAKRTAEKTMKEQEQEVAELTKWVQRHSAK